MIRKTLAGVTALLLALGMAALATTPAYAAGPQHNGEKVSICHSPSAPGNPWVPQSPNVNSMKGDGHIDPSVADTHAEDIIPPFWYDVHDSGPNWHEEYYPGKNLTTVFSGYTGAEILANGCVVPTPTPVTPAYVVADETCVADALVPGSISVTLKTGIVYSLLGPGNVVIDVSGGSSGPLVTGATYDLSATDADPNDKYAGSGLAVSITIGEYGDDCGDADPVPVTPDYSFDDQQCPSDVLVGGSITVDLSVPGVTYTITRNNVPVPFDPASGQTGALEPGDYLVEAVDADPNDGYELAAPWSDTVTILPYDGDCGPRTVTPAYQVDPQECVNQAFVGGFITVDVSVPGVTYTITKNNVPVPFDPATGTTGPLAPGTDYRVEAADADPNDAYQATPLSEAVTVDPDTSGLCDPVTLAGATPGVGYTEPTCAVPTGSYLLSNNQTLPGDAVPAVLWTVGGDPRAEGVSHSVPAGSTVKIVATANGPTWTLDNDLDGVIEYEHTFAPAPACGDLTTLALTGQSASPALAVAGFLGLLGVALIRSARRAAGLHPEA